MNIKTVCYVYYRVGIKGYLVNNNGGKIYAHTLIEDNIRYINIDNIGKIDNHCYANLLVLDNQLNIKEIYFHGELINE